MRKMWEGEGKLYEMWLYSKECQQQAHRPENTQTKAKPTMIRLIRTDRRKDLME